ncbi:unnamed protein product [Cylindrotheca closterium]|uniref:RNA helicase n=1 Tax=Cylindrotheca closterium TaxID=2856 RepID=A0AAD2FS57_9STRA|nr:unnamed protein product [Cylindrotheca closterium]
MPRKKTGGGADAGGGAGGGAGTDNNGGRGRGGRGGRGRGGRGRGRGGRGRGGRGNYNSNNNNNNNNNSNATGSSVQQDRRGNNSEYNNGNRSAANKQQKPVLKNGEKGADSHTVSEGDRIRLTKILMNLREGEDTRLEFPPTLTNTERKFTHELAAQLGLVSKSTGKGENRHIVVTKRAETKKKTGDEESMPVLNIGKSGINILKQHISKFPLSKEEENESKETGSSLVNAILGKDGNDDENLSNTLNRLGLGVAKGANIVQPREKRVDLDRRRSRHAFYQQQKTANAQEYKKATASRARLPAYSRQQEIVATVAANPVVVIQGETGCGKSTQCPQFLLDANPEANIVVTQPRRISAISIAERVGQEQCLQKSVGGLIGYQVRLEAASSNDTQLLFLTPGVLLRKLQSSPRLAEYTHIVIDEVHERDKYTEFLMITLRDLLPQRPDLRLVLMSATLQTDILMGYFTKSDHPYYQQHPPVKLEIEGRTFPVQEFFLEHILQMTEYIDPKTLDQEADAPMSMDELELELAKLMAPQQPKPLADESNNALRAMLGGDVDGSFGLSGAGADGDSVDQAYNMDAFEEYDVEETAELDEYNVADRPASDDAMPEKESVAIDESQLWDGIGTYEKGPVQDVALEDKLLDRYQMMHDDETVDTMLLLEVLHYIIKSSKGDGAILVFLPGWMEISEFSLLLESNAPFHNQNRYLILPLHSGIPSSAQRKVLQHPPKGVRKIVLSTNIAETSLTIDDVSFVVDTGRAKEKDYDPHLKTSTLQATWISKASAKQRKGRAGRTKAGVCFHLFSSRRHDSMREFVESELLRTPLEEMCLMTKKLGLASGGYEDPDGIPAFLGKAISAPHEKSVSNAIELLVDLGAMLPETNDLTDLGYCLSVLSLEPRVGKMVIWSYLLGCARATSQMAVAMSYKSPFVLPPQHQRQDAEKRQVFLSKNSESDQVTVFNALMEYDRSRKQSNAQGREFCRRNFLNGATIQMISDLRRNISRELDSLQFANPMDTNGFHNRHHKEEALWQAAISAGLYPNVATRKMGEVNFSTMTNRKAKIHVSSVNSVKGQPLNAKCQVPEGEVEFVCFGDMVKGNRHFTMSQTTHLASPLPLLLLCGVSLSVRPDTSDDRSSILNLDDWVIFRCRSDVASGLVMLRKRLEAAFLHAISEPSLGTDHLTEVEIDALETVGFVLKSAHRSTSVR